MGMFDTFIDASGAGWQTKALRRTLDEWRLGDEVPTPVLDCQIRVFGDAYGAGYAWATISDGRLTAVPAARDRAYQAIGYAGGPHIDESDGGSRTSLSGQDREHRGGIGIGASARLLSAWIDGSYDTALGEELVLRRRIGKLMEEVGEVGLALGGYTGENPRKGVTHTRDDVMTELIDVAVTALGAWEHMDGNHGRVESELETKLAGLLTRAGLVEPTSRRHPDHASLGPSACPACSFDPLEGSAQ